MSTASANSFLSLAFSSSSAWSRTAKTSRPSNLGFHLEGAASETAATFALSPCSFKVAMICLSPGCVLRLQAGTERMDRRGDADASGHQLCLDNLHRLQVSPPLLAGR